MKSLLLIRHAKSDWNDPELDDFDRPLNERGKKDAPEMAARLSAQKIEIDAIISSPAKRAAKTAKYFAEEFKIKKGDIIFKQDLYLASPAVFYSVIEKIDDEFDCVALFSHNEGITEFANMLTDARIDNIPTCGIFAVKITTKKWKHFREAEKEFWFADYPKSAGDNE
jgi:phosphohistidine phosphatase